MKSIIMTAEQTMIYDSGNEPEQHELMRQLRKQARDMAMLETVEIYTDDGILAEVACGHVWQRGE